MHLSASHPLKINNYTTWAHWLYMTEIFFVLFMLCKYLKIKENSLATSVYDKKIDKRKGSAPG